MFSSTVGLFFCLLICHWGLTLVINISLKVCMLSPLKHMPDFRITPVKSAKKNKKNAFGLNKWFTQSCCNDKFVLICAFFWCHFLIHRFLGLTKKSLIPTLLSRLRCVISSSPELSLCSPVLEALLQRATALRERTVPAAITDFRCLSRSEIGHPLFLKPSVWANFS